MKTALTLFSILFALTVLGQNQKLTEQDLLRQFKAIRHWGHYNGSDTTISPADSSEAANKLFQAALISYSSDNPASIGSGFTQLVKEGLTIATSDDGMFRIYTWDDESGGTMRFFKNVYQYKVDDKVYAKAIEDTTHDGPDPGYWYTAIYSLQNGGKTYYLAVRNGIYSTKDCYQGIKVFSIDHNDLIDTTPLIKTKTGIRNTLGFSYDFFSVVDRKERPVALIEYDPVRQTISIPVVLEEGKVTNRKIVYQFMGQYFEKVVSK